MERVLNRATIKKIGQTVRVAGWVGSIRSHGKIVFLDLRDRTGILQVVGKSDILREIGNEWVIEIVGKVNKRPAKMTNDEIETGKVELSAEKITVLSKAKNLPFAIDTDGYDISEEKRMTYRYLDLRRKRAARNILERHKLIKFIRDYLDKEEFVEIETPMLTKATPEGARDFVVPSRLQPKKFYALPQAPQQYKQLLQVAGFEKYFQIARCLRDEDPRGDRQPEHTQLDLEMSFVKREDIMGLIEKLYIEIVKNLYPDKKIQQIPFPKITHQQAMKEYKSDRPDLRKKKDDNLLAFAWIIDFPFFEKNKEGKWTFTHNPFSAPKSEFQDDLLKAKNIGKIITNQYDLALNGNEIGGGSIRSHDQKILKSVFKIIGHSEKSIEENFGHILEAFGYGAPPHGGIAMGIDRFLTIIFNEPSIREVIAFAKTGDGRDLMMNSPGELSKEQLKELKIKF